MAQNSLPLYDLARRRPPLRHLMKISYVNGICVRNDAISNAIRAEIGALRAQGYGAPPAVTNAYLDVVDKSGRIWATEHGPQGGDELNLNKDGRNYGWPFVTYGVDYGTHAWPINKTNGRHPNFEGPRFAWVPSA